MIDNMENRNVNDDFESYPTIFDALSALVAYGNPLAGGNSTTERSRRAKRQPRDRYGRFIKYKMDVDFDYLDDQGNQRTSIGKPLGVGYDGRVQVFVENDPYLGTGIFNVESNNISQYLAYLTPEQLKDAGIEVGKDADGKPITARDAKIIPSIAELNKQDAPDGWVLQEDGSFVSDDNAYRISPPAGTNKQWTLNSIDANGKEKKLGNHAGLGLALEEVGKLDTVSLMSDSDKQKYEDLKTDLAIARATKSDGDPAAQDAKRQAIRDADTALENHLNNAKLNETPTEQQAPATPAKKPEADLSSDIRKPTDDKRARLWSDKIMPAVRKSIVAAQDINKLRNTPGRKLTGPDIDKALQAVDRAFGPNLIGGAGFDADADSLRSLLKESIEMPRNFARDKSQLSTPEEIAELTKNYGTRNGELGKQINALSTALEARSKANDNYADTPTVDVSTAVPEVSKYEAPAYAGPAKRGRPAGTGKNQIAAKKAEEEAAKQKAEAPAPAPAPAKAEAPAGPTPEDRKAEAEAKKAEAEAKKAEAEAKKAQAEATKAEDDARRQKIEDARQKAAEKAEAPATDGGRRTSIDDWAGEQMLADWTDTTAKYSTDSDSLTDQAMGTAEMQGMDGAPQALSDAEFDAFDGEPLFRGVNSVENKQKFYEDENWVGEGGNGTGIYTSTSKWNAGQYGNFDDSQILDLKLRPDAVIMDMYDLEARRKADFDKALAEDNLLGAQLASGDLGVYATAIGVDGYRADILGFPAVVLTNREAVVARKSDADSAVEPSAPEAPATETGKDGGDQKPPTPPATPAAEQPAEEPKKPVIAKNADGSITITNDKGVVAQIAKGDISDSGNLGLAKVDGSKNFTLYHIPTGLSIPVPPGRYLTTSKGGGPLSRSEYRLKRDAKEAMDSLDSAGIDLSFTDPKADGETIPAMLQVRDWYAATNKGENYKVPATPAEDATPEDVTPVAEVPTAPESPEVPTPEDVTPAEVVEETKAPSQVVALDADGDINAQIQQAIADGNDVSFYYQGSATEPTLRTVTPDSIWNNPKTGLDNLYALPQGEDKKKNFTISKISNAPKAPASPLSEKTDQELQDIINADPGATANDRRDPDDIDAVTYKEKPETEVARAEIARRQVPKVDTPEQAEAVQADQVNAEQQAEESSNPDVIDAAEEEASQTEQALEQAPIKPPRGPRPPSIGAFTGKLAEQLDGITDPQQIKDIIDGQEIVYIDFETTGFSSVPGDGALNRPHQMGIIKVKNGQITDRRNIWMNPETPLSQWSKDNSKDNDGNDLSDEWLATQKSMKDAMQEAVDFIGPDAIIAGQYVQFDLGVLNQTLKEQGIDFSFAGSLDSRDLGSKTLPTWSPESPVGPTKTNDDGTISSSNSLGDLIAFLKGEGYDVDLNNAHNADADAEATHKLIQALLQRAIDKNQNLGNITDKAQIDAVSEQEWADYNAQYEAYKQELGTYFDQTQDADKDGRMAQAVPESRESIGVVYDKPATTPATSKTIDPNGDVQAQVQEAIDNGEDITFFYRSASGDRMRTVTPKGFWTNPKNGKLHAYADDPEDGKKNKSFELAKMESAPVDEAPASTPETTSDTRTPRTIDTTGDIRAQVDQAIADGNHPIAFRYTSASGTEDRIVSPQSITTGAQTGADLLLAVDLKKNQDRKYFLDRMEPVGDQAPTPSAPATTPAQTVPQPVTTDEPNAVPVVSGDSTAAPTLADTPESDVTPEEVTEADNTAPTADETASEAGADLSKITTRTTDEDYADESYMPTEEQRNVIDAAVSGLNVSVQALAGSGKTSTLVLLAKQMAKYMADKKILYIAFNKSVSEEANRRLPEGNSESSTGDALAVNAMKSMRPKLYERFYFIQQKKTADKKRPVAKLADKIADVLGIPSSDRDREDKARDTMRVIEKYSISEDDTITKDHFDQAGVAYTPENIKYADDAWADLTDDDGIIEYTFSHNMKIWALTRPDLSVSAPGTSRINGKADIIFFDEAQDINPVMARIIRDQNIQKVYVGDSRQAIYGFRGADNELDKVETDITLPMTRTFRFGQGMAAAGNRMLSLLKSPYKIIGAGKSEGEIVPEGSMNDADAILTRTNAGRFAEIITELNKGRVVGITKQDKNDAEALIATVEHLRDGARRPYNFHEDLSAYKSWSKLEGDVKRGKADKKVEMLYNLVQQYSTGQLRAIMAQVVELPDNNEKKVDTSSLAPLDISAGAKGNLLPGVDYSIEDAGNGQFNVFLTGRGTFNAKDDIKKAGINKFSGKTGTPANAWTTTDTLENIGSALRKLRGDESEPTPEIDVIVMTAHKSKGLEWGKVRIGGDFKGPEADENGNLVFPEKQELNLAYVALTRAMDVLDPGSLSWVYNYTDDTDADPNTPSRGIPEGATQKGVVAEEAPATPEADQKAEEITPAEGETKIEVAGDAPVTSDPEAVAQPDVNDNETPKYTVGDVVDVGTSNSKQALDIATRLRLEVDGNQNLTDEQSNRLIDMANTLEDTAPNRKAFVINGDNGLPVGVMLLREEKGRFAGQKILAVDSLYTAEANNGVGTAMMQSAAQKARDENKDFIVIGSVQKAKPFYAKMGALFFSNPPAAEDPDSEDNLTKHGLGAWSKENRDALAGGTPIDMRGRHPWMQEQTTVEAPATEQVAPVGTPDNPVTPSSQVIDTTTDISEPGTINQPQADNVDSLPEDDGSTTIGGRDLEIVEIPTPEAQAAPAPSGPGGGPPPTPAPDGPPPPDGPDNPERDRPPRLNRPDGWNPVDFDGLPTLSDDPNRDPRVIASNFTEDQIKDALKRGLVNDSESKLAGNYVSPRELYEALNQKGIDARRFVAEQYDAANGNTENVDALNKYYFDQPSMNPVSGASVDFAPAPANRQTSNALIPNTTDSGLDPAPADATTPEDDSTTIAETYDNVDLKDALVEAVKNDEPGVSLETPAGDTVVVPVENVRDALQKQGTDTNTVIDNATGATPTQQDVPDDVTIASQDSKPSYDPTKRFALNHYLQTRDIPADYRDAIVKIATDENATNEQLDWANGIMSTQPGAKGVTGPKTKIPLPEGTILPDKYIRDPGDIMRAIEAAYPGAKKLERTGDIIVASRDYVDKAGNRFKYETVAVRTSNELFYVYMRETNLTTGQTTSSRVSPFTHSAVALNNDIMEAQVEADEAYNRNLWYNRKSKASHSQYVQDESQVTLDDGTKESIHRREEPIHRDLTDAIKNAINKPEVSTQLAEAVYRHISMYGISDKSLRLLQADMDIDEATFNKIVDLLNSHISVQYKVRNYGTYVSADGKTPVEAGDIGTHTNLKTGRVRKGKIVARRDYELTKGYTYSDYVEFVPLEGTDSAGRPIYGKASKITSRAFKIERTALGTDGSERQDALQDYINVPIISNPPAAVAPMAPAAPGVTVPINRVDPARPTVDINGEAKPVTAERAQPIANFDMADVDASQLQTGDFFMTFDADLGLPRMAEVVSTRVEGDKFIVDAIIPNDSGTAKQITQEWAVNEDGLSGQRMIAMRRPTPEVVEPEKADDELLNRLLSTLRSNDTSNLSQEVKNAIADFMSGYINQDTFDRDYIEDLISEVSGEPKKGTDSVATDTVNVAKTIIAGDDTTEDNGNSTALQDTLNQAEIKNSELDASGVDPNAPKPLTGYTIKQNDRGVYYPETPITRGTPDFNRLKNGEVVPPNLPFVLVNTPNGDVHYYDENGIRRWGQFGAAGALLRRKKADGTYEYLLGKRGAGLSTDPNKWSTPGGAHANLKDSQTPGATAGKELGEELGVNMDEAQRVADLKNAVSPDWNYDYTLFEVPAGTNDNPQLKDAFDISETGWFTPEEIRKMQEDGMLHSAIDPEILNKLFELSSATDAPTTDAVAEFDVTAPRSLDGGTTSGGLGGSNPGEQLRLPDGTDVYAKYQKSEMHAANEVATAALYNKAGVKSADVKHGTKTGRENVTFSEIIPRTSSTPSSSPELQKKIREGFVIDAWLANWDGVLNDNTISDKDGNPVRVDVGGAMLFRAQGKPKGSNFGDVVGELDSLLDPRQNSTSAAIYGKPTPEQIKAGVDKLRSLSEADIDAIVDEAFKNVSPANKPTIDKLKKTLKARRQYILDKYGDSDNKAPKDSGGAPSSTTPDVTPVVEAPSVPTTAPEPTVSEGVQPGDSVSLDNLESAPEGRYRFYIQPQGSDVREYGLTKNADGTFKADDYTSRQIFGGDLSSPDITADQVRQGVASAIKSLTAFIPGSTASYSLNYRAGEDGAKIPPIQFNSETYKRYGNRRFHDSAGNTYAWRRNAPSSTSNTGIALNYWITEFSPAGTPSTLTEQELQDRIASGETFFHGQSVASYVPTENVTQFWLKSSPEGATFVDTSNQDNYGMANVLGIQYTKKNGEWVGTNGQKLAKKESEDSYQISEGRIGTKAQNYGGDEDTALSVVSQPDGGSYSSVAEKVAKTLSISSDGDTITNGTRTFKVSKSRKAGTVFTDVNSKEELSFTALAETIQASDPISFYRGTGVEGLVEGDRVTTSSAANYAPIGTVLLQDSALTPPKGTRTYKVKRHLVRQAGNWYDTITNEAVDTPTMKKLIKRSDVRLSSLPGPEAENPEDSLDLSNERKSQLSSLLSKYDTDGLLAGTIEMDGLTVGDGKELEKFLNERGQSGSLSPRDIQEGVIRFSSYSIKKYKPAQRQQIVELLGDLDSKETGVRGDMTLRQAFDNFEDAWNRAYARRSEESRRYSKPSSLDMLTLSELFPEIARKPTVVKSKKQLDDAPGEYPVIYRGVTPNREYGNTLRSAEIMKRFRNDDQIVWGNGVYGDGYYFSDNDYRAEGYANNHLGNVTVARLKEDAATVTLSEAKALKHVGYNAIVAYLISQGIFPGSTEFSDRFKALKGISNDDSFFPALFGYDATIITMNTDEDYYNLYSRYNLLVFDGSLRTWRNG